MADYSFWSLNMLGWEEAKEDYPSPLNLTTTTFVFSKPKGSAEKLFLLVEFLNEEVVYSKIEVYKYETATAVYAYTGKNETVTKDIEYAINDIYEKESIRSIASKLYQDALVFTEDMDKSKSSAVYTQYNKFTSDLLKAMTLRNNYKALGESSKVEQIDDLIFKLMLTYVFPIANETDDYYLNEIANIDPITVTYTQGRFDTTTLIGYIEVLAIIKSSTLDLTAPFVWKYKFFDEDPKISLYHYDCTGWTDWDHDNLEEIPATTKSHKWLAIAATLKNNLAEAIGGVQIGELDWNVGV